jgi:hypothetical protein
VATRIRKVVSMTGKTLLKEQETIYRESEYVHSVRAKGALSNSE